MEIKTRKRKEKASDFPQWISFFEEQLMAEKSLKKQRNNW